MPAAQAGELALVLVVDRLAGDENLAVARQVETTLERLAWIEQALTERQA